MSLGGLFSHLRLRVGLYVLRRSSIYFPAAFGASHVKYILNRQDFSLCLSTNLRADWELVSAYEVSHSSHLVCEVNLNGRHHQRDGVNHATRELQLLGMIEQPGQRNKYIKNQYSLYK